MELATALAGTDALGHLDDALDAARRATDANLLALCEQRLAEMLDHHDHLVRTTHRPLTDWRHDDALDDVERSALQFVEQYRIDVASLSDDDVEPLRAALGDAALVTFVNAVLVVEQRFTLELTLGAVL